MPLKLIDITPFLQYAQFFLVRGWPTTRVKDNAPAEEQQLDPEKKTRRARGEDSLSLGTHDAQTSYPLPTLAQDGILLKVGMGCFIGLFGAYSLIPPTTCPCGTYTCLHWRQSRTPGSLNLVSVTTKHISLQWACNKHLSMVELMLQDRLGKQHLVISFIFVGVYYLTTVEGMEGVSSRIIFESSGLRKQE